MDVEAETSGEPEGGRKQAGLKSLLCDRSLSSNPQRKKAQPWRSTGSWLVYSEDVFFKKKTIFVAEICKGGHLTKS